MDDYKEIVVDGCICVPPEVETEQVIDEFIEWLESKDWSFGGGIGEED